MIETSPKHTTEEFDPDTHEPLAGFRIQDRGGYVTTSGDWVDVSIDMCIDPEKIVTAFTHTTEPLPEQIPYTPEKVDNIAQWANEVAIFAEVMDHDLNSVLGDLGYSIASHNQGNSVQHILTTPSIPQTSKMLVPYIAPMGVVPGYEGNVDNLSIARDAANRRMGMANGLWTAEVHPTISRGLFLETLNGHMGVATQRHAEAVYKSGDEAAISRFADAVRGGYRSETLLHALRIINGFQQQPAELLEEPRAQWDETLKVLADKFMPLVSGRYGVETIRQERAQIGLYLAHIANVFRLKPDYYKT